MKCLQSYVAAAPVDEYISLAATCAAVSRFAPTQVVERLAPAVSHTGPSPVVAHLAPARTTTGKGRTVSPRPFRGPPSAKQFRGWSPRGPVDAGENLVFAFHLDDQIDGKLTIDGVNSAHYTRVFAYTHLVSFSKFNCTLVPP